MSDAPVSERLLEAAQRVSEHAHSPYSGVQVGAAVIDTAGRIHVGCNLENASFGLTQCAERNALGAAVAAGAEPGSLRELAIYARGFARLSPCGACRQVMIELMAKDAVVHCLSDDGTRTSWALGQLFPDPFSLET